MQQLTQAKKTTQETEKLAQETTAAFWDAYIKERTAQPTIALRLAMGKALEVVYQAGS